MLYNADDVSGTVTFTHQTCSDGSWNVRLSGDLDCPGCNSADANTHGFHIHQKGSLYNGDGAFDCTATGPHFSDGTDNGTSGGSLPHGESSNDSANRHYGDLGNVVEVGGAISVDIQDSVCLDHPAIVFRRQPRLRSRLW